MLEEQEYIKDFIGWQSLKKQINDEEKMPTIKKKEIWWCSTGINIGVEQDGKNALYERPVLVMRKFNTRLFWGIPITSQLKDFPFYYPIFYKAPKDKNLKERRAMILQLRAYDSIRLTRCMGRLDHEQFAKLTTIIKKAI